MRRLIYNVFSTDAALMALLPGGLFGDRAEIPSDTLRPFGILTHEGPNPGVSRMMQSRSFLWVHDEPGDYTRIDAVLKMAREVLLTAVPTSLNGVWLNDVRWEGVSPDLFDDTRRTNVKNAAFLLTGNGL